MSAVTSTAAIGAQHLLDLYINEHRDQWHEADEPVPNTTRPYWRASGIGKCLRSQCLQRAGVEKTRPMQQQAFRTFQLGDDLHWFARKRWARLGLLIAEEIELVDTELVLSGHIDAVIGGEVQEVPEAWRVHRNPDWIHFLDNLRTKVRGLTGGTLPVRGEEIKSISQWSLRQFPRGCGRSDHMMQLGAYKLLAERHPDSMPAMPEWWELFYIQKDPLIFVEPIRLGDKWVDEVQAALESLNMAWESGSWPNCTCGNTRGEDDMQWELKYCDWPNESGGCCNQTLLELLERSVEASR